ncbi:MAG TPA: hypothetical protein DEP42_03015 [Ruminococcaceae bacterium]|nr:hypothetical protein [Oscillospiraceae bacterium]
MKRLFILLILIPLFIFCTPTLSAYAADAGQILNEQTQKSGAAGLNGKTPAEAKGALGKLGVKGADSKGVSGFSLSKVFSWLWNSIRKIVTAPFKATAAVFGILLFCALAGTMKNSFADTAMKGIFENVCALSIAGVLILPITKCVAAASTTIHNSAIFLSACLPVFGGLAAASGHPASAVLAQGSALLMAQVISQIASTTFVPLVGIFLAFCVIGSIAPSVNIIGLAGFAKKIVTVGLALAMTVFSAVLTIQGFISQAADSVTMKTAKFVVSNAVPLVGNTVSDALNTVASCAGLLKNAVGAYAIIVFLAVYLPVLLECLIWTLVVSLSSALAETMNMGTASNLLKGMSSALQMLTALIVAAALTMMISICIMLLVTGQT